MTTGSSKHFSQLPVGEQATEGGSQIEGIQMSLRRTEVARQIHRCGALTGFQGEDVNTKESRRPIRVAEARWRSSPRLDGSRYRGDHLASLGQEVASSNQTTHSMSREGDGRFNLDHTTGEGKKRRKKGTRRMMSVSRRIRRKGGEGLKGKSTVHVGRGNWYVAMCNSGRSRSKFSVC